MKLKLALDEKLMDVRLRDRHLSEGKITNESIDSFLADLPADDANLEKIVDKEAAAPTE